MHELLSHRLARILEADGLKGGLTLNQLLLRTEGRGLYLAMIILCLPFITPIPLPGVSTVVGSVVMVLACRLALGLPPRLPRFLGEHPLPPGMQRAVLSGSVKILRWIEKYAKPRRTQWLGWPAARAGNALVLLFLGLLLALPIPPVMLFSNSLPGLAIILMAVSMMEEDGLMIWVGYLSTLLTVAWLAVSAGVIVAFFSKFMSWFMDWIGPQP